MKIASMMKLGLILAAYAAAACVLLAFVYTGTEKIIAAREEKDQIDALKGIFPDADGFIVFTDAEYNDIASPYEIVTIKAAFKAVKNDETVGVALTVSCPGYSGPIITMVGVSGAGIITGVKIMEHSDTPGLGANAASPAYFVDRAGGITFYGQFAGKSINDPFEIRNDVAAVTASTITSKAIAQAVRAAGIAVTAWLTEVTNNEH